jgi:hypothetical protein
VQQSEGLFTPTGKEDILSTAIGKKDHPGRTRGVGGFATQREAFGIVRSNGKLKPSKLLVANQIIASQNKRFAKLERKIAKMAKHFPISDDDEDIDDVPERRQSSRGSNQSQVNVQVLDDVVEDVPNAVQVEVNHPIVVPIQKLQAQPNTTPYKPVTKVRIIRTTLFQLLFGSNLKIFTTFIFHVYLDSPLQAVCRRWP